MTITFEYKNKTWQIDYDGTTFIPRHVYESDNKEGQSTKRIKDLGYFSSLGLAIKKIVGCTLGESNETIPLAVFVERYENAVKELKAMLESEF